MGCCVGLVWVGVCWLVFGVCCSFVSGFCLVGCCGWMVGCMCCVACLFGGFVGFVYLVCCLAVV